MRVMEIQRRIQNAKDLDFGTLFNQSIELFKKVWVQGFVTIMLNMVLAIPVIMIVYIPLIFTGILEAYSSGYDPYPEQELSPLTMVVLFVIYVVMIVAMSTIGFGLKAAFYRICKLRDLDQTGREDYFYFLKKMYVSKTIKLGLAFAVISIVATLLCFIPMVYAVVPLSFMVIIYAFNPDMSISDIVKLGFHLGNSKWLMAFGLMVVSGLLAGIVGMMMCFVGLYLTASFSYLPHYFIYKEVVGFDGEDEIKHME